MQLLRQLALTLLFLAPLALQAQYKLDFEPPIDADTPPWALEMYRQRPNVRVVDSAYLAFYKNVAFEKTIHTQYYKRWRRQVEPWLQADGFIRLPQIELERQAEEKYLRSLAEPASRNSPPAEWTCIGPFDTYSTDAQQTQVSWQANVYAIDQSLSDPNILYAGTESGGVFKTSDKGLHWMPVSHETLMATITAVKVHPQDADIVYAGDGRRVYKTTDGGQHWNTVLDQADLNVNDIAINPANPEIILVSCEKGLFRSTNGGLEWTSIFTQRCWDIEIKPNDPQVVYVLKSNPSDKRTEFFKSTDQGLSFSIRQNGWYASSDANRREDGARMSVTPADPERVYVVLIGNSKAGDNGFIGIYRSQDAGENWVLPNLPVGGPYTANHPNLMTLNNTNTLYQGYYNLGIAASHSNPDHLLIGGLNLWRTTDGATTFTPLGGYQGNVGWIHPDQQEIEINGTDMWVVNDGGINYSTDLFATHQSRKFGLTASDFWGFGNGWNEDLIVGGRYHNGNTAYRPGFGDGRMLRLGGAEASTGYVNPGERQEAYFSDINSKLIPFSLTGQVKELPALSLYPNESYFAAHSSELEFHPHCYNCIFVGRENKLWRSNDGGRSFELVYEFGANPDAPLLQFEISRSNPLVMYVYQRTSFYGATLWKSADGGQSWQSKAFPAAPSQRAGSISLSAENENALFVSFGHQNNNGAKVFVTYDGGDNWVNLSTPTLDGHSAVQVLAQGGTNEALYLSTNLAVFYRDSASADWSLYNQGLPYRAAANIMRPFYKEGKLRMATYGNGVWESPLAAVSRPIAQPIVDKLYSSCARDTFYFNDYSIARHEGLNWQWTFPGASFVSDANARNPKVVYAQTGVYDVTMRITDAQGQWSEKTIPAMVTVADGCAPDQVPGLALKCTASGDQAITDDFERTVSALTISAWIKPDGIQNDYTGIVMNEVVAGFNFREGNNTLGYHWPNGGQWWWDSNLAVPPGEWSHVAMVYTPESITLYLNGRPATQNISLPPVSLTAFRLGSYRDWSDRNYKGLMDEVAIWDRALSQEEIRELRHLTKIPATDSTLLAYYQFNETEGQALDRAGIKHAAFLGGATRFTSTAPVGGGVSFRQEVSAPGTYDFGATGVQLSLGEGLSPQGEVVASRLNLKPDYAPGQTMPGPVYWVLNNYGINDAFDAATSLRFNGVGQVPAAEAGAFRLFNRLENGEGETWFEIAPATEAPPANPGYLLFDVSSVLGQLGQFAITTDTSLLTSTELQEYLPSAVLVYPNPAAARQSLRIRTSFEEAYRFQLYDASGKQVLESRAAGTETTVQLPALAAGYYVYRLTTGNRMWHGKVMVKE